MRGARKQRAEPTNTPIVEQARRIKGKTGAAIRYYSVTAGCANFARSRWRLWLTRDRGVCLKTRDLRQELPGTLVDQPELAVVRVAGSIGVVLESQVFGEPGHRGIEMLIIDRVGPVPRGGPNVGQRGWCQVGSPLGC